MSKERESFGSRAAVIMAMAGSAIGLGNIWRFPYMVGEHGGGAFVFVYVMATLLVSLPVFVAEVTLGRMSRCSAYGSMSKYHSSPVWKFAGILTILIPTVIGSYYSVIGGWSLNYMFRSLAGEFVMNSPEAVSGIFAKMVSVTWLPIVMNLLFMTATCAIVACGVKIGIEKFNKFTIPALFVLIILIVIYSVTLPGAGEGVKYLLKPDFSQLDAKTFAYAIGQSFYSLSLGSGVIITYGSYVSKKENIFVSSAGTAASDLGFAILAGLAVMPAVFADGIAPGAGPGLLFETLPFIFSTMGAQAPVLSAIVSIVFFIAVVVAALTSCVSVIEVGVSFLLEKTGLKRWQASLILFAICGTIGSICAYKMVVLNTLDWLTSNVLLIILAVLTVVFVGFFLPKETLKAEFTNEGTNRVNVRIFPLIYFLIKWVEPVALIAIFVCNFIL